MKTLSFWHPEYFNCVQRCPTPTYKLQYLWDLKLQKIWRLHEIRLVKFPVYLQTEDCKVYLETLSAA